MLSVLLLWSAQILLLWICSCLLRKSVVSPELARKLVHMGLGIPVLGLPWLFSTHLQVWVLLSGSAVLLAGFRYYKNGIGAGLHTVTRSSIGEFAYIGGVLVVWHLSSETPTIYVASLLILIISDATAALIGSHFGRRHFRGTDGDKTWEGSIAFFISAMILITGVFTMGTDQASLHLFILALIISLLVMMMEAVSWRGWDNFFVPVAVCILLQQYLSLTLSELGIRFAVLLALFGFLQLSKKSSLLSDGGALAAVLAGYFCYVLGDGVLLMTVLIFFIAYMRTTRIRPSEKTRIHDLPAVLAITGPALLWALLGWLTENLYSVEIIGIFSVQLGCTLVARKLKGSILGKATLSSIQGWGLCAVPAFGIYRLLHQPSELSMILLLLPLGLLHTHLFLFWLRLAPSGKYRWQLHTIMGFSTSILIWNFRY